MTQTRNWLLALVALGCLVAVGTGCGDDEPTGDAGQDGGSGDGDGDGGGDGDGDGDGGHVDSPLLEAPEAEEVASVELEEPITDVVYAEDLAIGLHEESGISLLDMSDPTEPRVLSTMPTSGRAISVALDVRLRILFVLTVNGELRAYRVGDVENPEMQSSSSIQEPGSGGNPFQGMVRILDRLYLLGETHIVPVSLLFGASGSVSFLSEEAIEIDEGAFSITYGGSRIYVAFANGHVQTFRSGGSVERIGDADLGAEIAGWVARGSRILVALRGLGLRVLAFEDLDNPRMVFDAPEFDDLEGLERFGNMVIVSLTRGLLVALDLSDFTAPRALVSRQGTLPNWIAPIGGNLLLGGGTTLSVFGVPPFISASVPAISRSQFPRYGKIPLQLSKAVDPTTVTVESVILTCGGTEVSGSVVVSLDNFKITFVPDETLPAGVTCTLSFDGVQDSLGLPLSGGESVMAFDTVSAEPAPIENPHSSYAHGDPDGAFTDWTDDAADDAEFEYFDVTGARGMYSYFYADYDGSKLWLLNDWFYNGDDIDPDCYNQFGVWTGNGQQSWDIRAYGDQHIEVRLNGTLLEEDDERVMGGYSHSASPNDPELHTIYEIAVETEPGSWGVQLHDPGPTFSCQQLETDPTNYNGTSMADTTMIDATQGTTAPPEPTPSTRAVTSTTPTLTWSLGDNGGQFTTYVFVISSGEGLSRVFYRVTVYGTQITLPPGLLRDGQTYTWQVIAFNLAGSAMSEPVTFTVGDAPDVSAPVLTSVDPTSVVQGSSPTVTINGTGFVEGARAYFKGVQLSTTFVSSTQLTAMFSEATTADVDNGDITVRNDPNDDSTESNGIKFSVTEAQSTGVTISLLAPSMVIANTQNAITVTHTFQDGATYVLNYTPAAGAGGTTTCTIENDTTCIAALPGLSAGTWTLSLSVTVGADAPYNTNTLPLTVNAPSTVGLTSINPQTIPANTVTMVNAVMTNAPNTNTYQLILQPTGGGAGSMFTCTMGAIANQCAAAVNIAAGTYNVAIRVNPGNTLTNVLAHSGGLGLTVNAPAACTHNACLPGGRLTDGCSTCVTAVCDTVDYEGCCSTSWTQECVDLAALTVSCDCTPVALANSGTLNPATQEEGASTPVVVDLQNGATGYNYVLHLMPNGGGTLIDFPCTYVPGTGNCTATISSASLTVANSPYAASVTVTDPADPTNPDSPFTTALVSNAFSVTAPAGLSCFTSANAAVVGGSGTCVTPYTIDLTGQVGSTLTATLATLGTVNFGLSGDNNCGWAAAAPFRAVVDVAIPTDTNLEVSLDPVFDNDVRLAVLTTTVMGCTMSEGTCVNEVGGGVCEVVQLLAGNTFLGTTARLIVASDDDNPANTVLHLRTVAQP